MVRIAAPFRRSRPSRSSLEHVAPKQQPSRSKATPRFSSLLHHRESPRYIIIRARHVFAQCLHWSSSSLDSKQVGSCWAVHLDKPSLLEGSSSVRSLSLKGGEKLHARRILGIGLSGRDTDGARKVFDDMLTRRIAACVANKLSSEAVGLLCRMIAENIRPDENTFASVLKACSGNRIALHFVKEIHGKIVCHGFGTSPLVCNPLIDLYSKNGFIDDAKRVFRTLRSRDSISWVAMISGFSQNGREREALLLFCRMHNDAVRPTPYLLSSTLSACTKIDLFKLGEQVHGLILRWGFSTQICVCNALLTLYCRAKDWMSAELIFSGMEFRDGVSYNSLIAGLAQHGLCDEAVKLFHSMLADCLKPNHVTVATLLSACADAGYLRIGEQLHSYAEKTGILSDIVIEGSLLDLYVKCSDIETAHKCFLSTNRQNVVLWNLMLVAFGQSDNLIELLEILRKMQIKGIVPNQYTFPSILKTCISLGTLYQGEQIHSHIIKNGFQHNVYVCSVLLEMYAKCGKLDSARNILSRLTEEDVVSWTTMIAGYVQHDLFGEALQLFKEMQNQGIQLDNIGLSSAITASAGIPALHEGRQIHAQCWVSGFSLDLSIGNALLSLYSRCGRIKEAYSVFQKVDVEDNVSWNALISGFGQSGCHEEALQVFARMNKAGVEANLYTFCSAVKAAASTANMIFGRQIHAAMITTGYYSKTEASNVLITLYAKCGSICEAKREFDDMPEKNEVSWNAMIHGYSQHGYGVEAVNLFDQMMRQGMTPNSISFVGALSACSHVGLVEKGLKYFESMKVDFCLVPDPEHYVCIVDLLGRAGHLRRAKKFVEEMPIEPDAMIWRTLLSACTIHKHVGIGEFAACHLQEMEPEDSAAYVLLSNMYALTGKWDLRDSARRVMKERGVKKEPGRSWIEVKNSVHAFYVGDRLHPLTDEIYKNLGDLNSRAAEIGYVEKQCSLWSDAEHGQKDPMRFVHSEKLAIAFGLLSLPELIPVRVIKNIRICDDCHNWIKFVSKISSRTIIVRDAYRFHHFDDGLCSCRDYW
ncbi:pentatricopeptide repeat-containing protein At4g13650 [Eucalyptus grandis]|uniref:pentatricopeptide repeat-containing protein At4g13650 n=1 Tax=Eucalyptus grandis TaxID=71139 RepID=UPI00192ECD56|nr:pentatricopeptide repeat-containing protein At4g13650 [Eucalyptus grandis]XP_018720148.2 pentatricopeptide repeat-containing protein At4g13650 [Eucalyptus grandis]XP_039160867.1 pentatricopeptide repeat-containing protein At4g13650 [Eucalyptus grandis]XP_039160868.1 pentatricopeptide repeat-containing protein At4g13650 [Eucalyptus grandis]XP_039160869.1 pentatricopeptide repeat-containing protein At4g13650 [Eucalyptus grandis]XP_039160870.1 pentatricopeptide repeat-containing protein At4g13